MDIHKPKPVHGWREFLTEVGIIVLGVLIALVAEQTAETLHVRHMIHESEAAMRSELLDDDLPQAYVRLAVGPCLRTGLADLRAVVAAGAEPQALKHAAEAYAPPVRTWDSDAWRATLASAAATRMDSADLLRWSHAYSMMPFLQEASAREQAALRLLRRTRYVSGRPAPARVDELSDIVDDLEDIEDRMNGMAAVALGSAEKSGLSLSPQRRQQLTGEARSAFGGCVVQPDLAFLRDLATETQASTPEQRRRFKQKLGTHTY